VTKNGRTVLGYKDHRAVDDRCGIVTATETTDAARADGSLLETVLDQHEAHTATAAARHGFKRARWRGLANVRVQNLLIATIQNVRKRVKYARRRRGGEVLRRRAWSILTRWAVRARAWAPDLWLLGRPDALAPPCVACVTQ